MDGQWTPALTDALKAFQQELGVPETGAADAATIAAFHQATAARQAPSAAPTAAATPTAVTTPTASETPAVE